MNSVENDNLSNQRSPEKWLANHLENNNIGYDYKTDGLTLEGQAIEDSLALASIRLDAHEEGAVDIRPHIRDALLVWRHEKSRESIARLSKNLAYQKDSDDIISKWVLAVTGENSKLDHLCVQHFIWQVKRKLLGLPVEHHLMPILYGKSGGGKSVAVSKLVEPLKMVSLAADMSIFEDQFSKKLFTRNYILFFDELQGSLGVDINRMKQIITASAVEWRQMRSERVFSAPQNATFIGCTNDPVKDRIKDPTSARRFWEIRCSESLDWNTINEIDYLKMWQSVDENTDCPLKGHIDEIRKVQNDSIRSKDPIEDWIDLNIDLESPQVKSLTTTELYVSFKSWCSWQNIKTLPQLQKFSRDFRAIIESTSPNVTSRKTNRGTEWFIALRVPEKSSDVTEDLNQLSFDF